jgi:hypothetical protein
MCNQCDSCQPCQSLSFYGYLLHYQMAVRYPRMELCHSMRASSYPARRVAMCIMNNALTTADLKSNHTNTNNS